MRFQSITVAPGDQFELAQCFTQLKPSNFYLFLLIFLSFSAFVKQLVEELDLFELECKLDMFRVRQSFFLLVLFFLLLLLFFD